MLLGIIINHYSCSEFNCSNSHECSPLQNRQFGHRRQKKARIRCQRIELWRRSKKKKNREKKSSQYVLCFW